VSRLDPRNPLVLDTREVARRPGEMRAVTRSAPAPEGLGVGVAGVPAGTEIQLDLRLESVIEGLLVSGTVRTEAVGECVRCLDPVELDVELPVQELYAYPDATTASDEDVQLLEADLLDLGPVLRDAVVLALPLQPVCRDDCPGLCPTCGAKLADDPSHQHEQLDPRWAALQDLTPSGPTQVPTERSAQPSRREEG
jgi:uncharacterized protein